MKVLRQFFVALVAATALLFAHGAAYAAGFYVDNTLGDVPPEAKAAVAEPHPVQLLFSFKTNGAANARATNYLNNQITDVVSHSGVFSSVGSAPVENGAIISITIDNIPEAGAAQRGFATGLTFGLHGSAVSDFYEATVEYVSGPGAAAITKTARHRLITTIGRTDPPENATRAENVDAALHTVVRQLLDHTLNDLAGDPAFAPPAPAATTETPAATTATEPAAAETEAPATETQPEPAH